MIQILRKPGWILNPNDKVVNAILKRCELNDGECPCHNTGKTKEERLCPCKSYIVEDKCHCRIMDLYGNMEISDYRENDTCHCGLYLKEE